MSATSFAAAHILRAIPRVRLSRAVGRLCEQPLPAVVSRAIEHAYVRAYGINMSEAAPLVGAYPSFDAFFTRQLRVGARVVADAPVVSPADGVIQATGPIDAGASISVKGHPYDVGELIGNPEQARDYCGGEFAVVYLSPRDYHRVHAPVDARFSHVCGIAGDLLPVNAIGERHFPRLFVRNRRVAMSLDSEALGRVMLVMVGAVIVGRITVKAIAGVNNPEGHFPLEPAVPVSRGDELGTFHLGSTVVLLVPPGLHFSCKPGLVRYGEALAKGV